jgi:hypothetical protein
MTDIKKCKIKYTETKKTLLKINFYESETRKSNIKLKFRTEFTFVGIYYFGMS